MRALAYAVPQVWAPASGMTALPFSLRSHGDFPRARLGLAQGGTERWAGAPTKLMRKRRIALDTAAFDNLGDGDATIAVR